MKEPEIPPAGADPTDRSFCSKNEHRPAGTNADVSVLSPEITLALVEAERDFLLGKIGDITATAEAVSAMTERIERLEAREATGEEQASMLRQRMERFEAAGNEQVSV